MEIMRMKRRNIFLLLSILLMIVTQYALAEEALYKQNDLWGLSAATNGQIEGSEMLTGENQVDAETCPDFSLFGQDYNVPTDTSWVATTSDIGAGGNILVYDNIVGTGEINRVAFWGINGFYLDNWYVCYESPLEFEIKFYADNNGQPGSETSSYLVSCVGNQTGLIYRGVFELYVYYADLPAAVAIDDGWISIQGQGDRPDCWFEWMSSETGVGDGGFQWDGYALNDIETDRAFCLMYQEYRCGDIDGDNTVTIFDVVYFLNYKYKHGPPPLSFLTADINKDDVLNILDITRMLSFLYKNGADLDCP